MYPPHIRVPGASGNSRGYYGGASGSHALLGGLEPRPVSPQLPTLSVLLSASLPEEDEPSQSSSAGSTPRGPPQGLPSGSDGGDCCSDGGGSGSDGDDSGSDGDGSGSGGDGSGSTGTPKGKNRNLMRTAGN